MAGTPVFWPGIRILTVSLGLVWTNWPVVSVMVSGAAVRHTWRAASGGIYICMYAGQVVVSTWQGLASGDLLTCVNWVSGVGGGGSSQTRWHQEARHTSPPTGQLYVSEWSGTCFLVGIIGHEVWVGTSKHELRFWKWDNIDQFLGGFYPGGGGLKELEGGGVPRGVSALLLV